MAKKPKGSFQDLFGLKFGAAPPPSDLGQIAGTVAYLAARRSHRR